MYNLLTEIEKEILSKGYKKEDSNYEYVYRFALIAAKQSINVETIFKFLQSEIKSDATSFRQAIERAYKSIPKVQTPKSKEIEKNPIIEGENFLKYLDIRYNVVRERREIRDGEVYRTMKESDENSIYIRMLKSDIKISQQTFKALIDSISFPLYHPFTEYYISLPKWEGKTDFIESLARTIKTTNQPYFEKCLRKFLVGVVAASVDGKANHQVLVLQGSQGSGKTTWLSKLLPERLDGYGYLGGVQPSNRDSLMLLADSMFINMDELENLNKTELNGLKSFITSPEVKIRKWYGKYHETYPRRASFVASINTSEFLRDTTGDRRFLCFEVNDVNYNHDIDMDLVYSQAYALYKSGYKFYFDSEDIEEINQNNEQFRHQAPEEELIITYYRVPNDGDSIERMNATQIIEDLNMKITVNSKLKLDESTKIRVGKIMAKLKYETVKHLGLKCYKLTLNSAEALEQERPMQFNDILSDFKPFEEFQIE